MSLRDFFWFDSFYIAWRYLTYNRARSLLLIACITLIAVLPLSLELLLTESERQLLARAETTPLVVGVKGSSLDLVMNSLYFGDTVPELLSMAAVDRVTETDLALPIPLSIRFQARGFPIVGTTLDYFDFRRLEREGRRHPARSLRRRRRWARDPADPGPRGGRRRTAGQYLPHLVRALFIN